jgi:hypothetical protein
VSTETVETTVHEADESPSRGLSRKQIQLLLSPLDANRVKQANGQSHLEAWDVRRWLLRVFGWDGWSFELISCDLVYEQIRPQLDNRSAEIPGKFRTTVVYRVLGRLRIRDRHGNELGVWEDGATGDAVNQPSIGDAHDMALKTANSQALKRCAMNLGDQFGLSLYNDGSADQVVGGTAAEPETLVREPKPAAYKRAQRALKVEASEWENAPVPDDNLYADLHAAIEGATSAADLKDVAKLVKGAVEEMLISPNQRAHLIATFEARDAEIKQGAAA